MQNELLDLQALEGTPGFLQAEALREQAGAPSAALIASIRTLGIIQPVAATRLETGGYRLDDGRRRVGAALLLRMEMVPALIFPTETPWHTAVARTLAANLVRAPNLAGELEAVLELQEKLGKLPAARELAEQLRLPARKVDQVLRLLNLVPDLRQAFLDGAMKKGVALQAARLSKRLQRRLATVWKKHGRVLGQDLKDLRTTQRKAAEAGLEGLELEPESAHRVLGRPHTGDARILFEFQEKALQGDKVAMMEWAAMRGDGRSSWVSVYSSLTEALGVLNALLQVLHDQPRVEAVRTQMDVLELLERVRPLALEAAGLAEPEVADA